MGQEDGAGGLGVLTGIDAGMKHMSGQPGPQRPLVRSQGHANHHRQYVFKRDRTSTETN